MVHMSICSNNNNNNNKKVVGVQMQVQIVRKNLIGCESMIVDVTKIDSAPKLTYKFKYVKWWKHIFIPA